MAQAFTKYRGKSDERDFLKFLKHFFHKCIKDGVPLEDVVKVLYQNLRLNPQDMNQVNAIISKYEEERVDKQLLAICKDLRYLFSPEIKIGDVFSVVKKFIAIDYEYYIKQKVLRDSRIITSIEKVSSPPIIVSASSNNYFIEKLKEQDFLRFLTKFFLKCESKDIHVEEVLNILYAELELKCGKEIDEFEVIKGKHEIIILPDIKLVRNCIDLGHLFSPEIKKGEIHHATKKFISKIYYTRADRFKRYKAYELTMQQLGWNAHCYNKLDASEKEKNREKVVKEITQKNIVIQTHTEDDAEDNIEIIDLTNDEELGGLNDVEELIESDEECDNSINVDGFFGSDIKEIEKVEKKNRENQIQN